MKMDFQSDLTIDKNHLDDECLEQPGKYLKYAELLVEAEEERDKLKRKRDVVYAEVEERVRAEAEDSGEKLTEAKVKAKVVIDKVVAGVEDELLKATTKAKLLAVGVEAFQQRKKSIEQLCSLYGLGYFAQPKGKAVTETKSKMISEKLNTKKKK